MIDRQKAIEAFTRCGTPGACSDKCAYFSEGFNCYRAMKHDLLELLKEQKAVSVDTKTVGMPDGKDIEVNCCRDCRTILDPTFYYCPHCGKGLKWD